MYDIVTLTEVKEFMKIGLASQFDDILKSLIKDATEAIEGFIAKRIITRQYTEYHDGRNKVNIITRNYPIYKVGSLYDDTNHDFGTADLIDLANYRIEHDPGIITLTGDESVFVNGRENVKVIYYAGYSRFLVIDENNNYLDIKESGGTEIAVEIPSASDIDSFWPGYSAEDLATAIQTALNAKDGLNFNYAVSYNHSIRKFTISTGTDFQLMANTGASNLKSIWDLIGISTKADMSAGTSKLSDIEVTGVPNSLRLAAKKLIAYWYEQSGYGKAGVNIESVSLPAGAGTTSYLTEVPKDIMQILDKFVRII
jgi:hypothetical protein